MGLVSLQEYFISTTLITFNVYVNYVNSIWGSLPFVLYHVCSLFSMSVVFLYLILGLLAIELYRQMRIEMKDAAVVSNSLSNRAQLERLDKWKLRYVLLTQLIDCINNCFGLVLLQSIIFFYVSIVNSAFYVFLSLAHGYYLSFANNIYNIGKHICYLLAIAYVPYKIKNEVRVEENGTIIPPKKLFVNCFFKAFNIVKILRTFNFNETKLLFKVRLLLKNV